MAATKRNRLLTRSVMDIHAVDATSEFFEYYATEDEFETDYDTDGNVVKTSTSRISKILRSDIRKANSMRYVDVGERKTLGYIF